MFKVLVLILFDLNAVYLILIPDLPADLIFINCLCVCLILIIFSGSRPADLSNLDCLTGARPADQFLLQ